MISPHTDDGKVSAAINRGSVYLDCIRQSPPNLWSSTEPTDRVVLHQQRDDGNGKAISIIN